MTSARWWLGVSGSLFAMAGCGSSTGPEGDGGSGPGATTGATTTASGTSSASASSSSGMVECDGSGNCNMFMQGCVQCSYTGPCKAQYDACYGETGNADCKAFSDCVDACHGDEACLTTCEADHAMGAPIWEQLAKCAFCEACKVDCMLPPDAPLCM